MTVMESADESNVFSDTVNRLLNTLEVQLHNCTVCSVPQGTRARFDPVDAITVHYILAGEGSFRTGDGQMLPFGPQSVVIAPARSEQSWNSSDGLGEEVHGQARCVPIDDQFAMLTGSGLSDDYICVIRSELSITNGGVPGFFDHLRAPIFENLVANDEARQIFDLLIAEMTRPRVGSQAVSEGLMKAFLILLLRRHLHRSEASSFTMVSDRRLARAMIHILERPEQPHTVDTLAAAAGMSRTAFLERFKEAFSQSPIEFLQEFRLKFAAHLLKTTNLPIKSVAVAVGYSSRSYFSRAFRASYAMDPSAYRVESRMQRQRLESPPPPLSDTDAD
jgi:AraC family transcriptional regulator, activator of mtrCDE